jgi:Na+/H+-dicarboxylate symporter
MGFVAVAVFAVRNLGWVELMPLGLTIILAHLGLLFWELRYVSLSLAYPGFKPRKQSKDKSTQQSESITR